MTDGARAQYHCKEKQIKSAGFAKEHGITKVHWVAPKFGFKGPWDAMNRVARQKVSKAILRGECTVTQAIEFAIKSAMECKTPLTVWGEGTGQTSWRHRKDGTVDSYTHVMAAPSAAVGTEYRKIISERLSRLKENEHDKVFELDVIVAPKEKYQCTGIPGIAEVYAFMGRNPDRADELFLCRRGCVCAGCRNANPSVALGDDCTSAIPGKYFKAPAMKYKAGNNVARVTRTIAEERDARRKMLKVGTYIAAQRETDNTSLLNERCYEISRVVKKPTKSKGKTRDYLGEKIRKGAYYITVNDYECLPDRDRFFKLRKEEARLGMICECKPGEDMFFNCDVEAASTSSSGTSFKISDDSHDNLQGLYQSTREVVSGIGVGN